MYIVYIIISSIIIQFIHNCIIINIIPFSGILQHPSSNSRRGLQEGMQAYSAAMCVAM